MASSPPLMAASCHCLIIIVMQLDMVVIFSASK
jgi:hypothetical protein